MDVFTDNPDAQQNRARKAVALADELNRRGYYGDTLPSWAHDDATPNPERRACERAANVSRSSDATWALARSYVSARDQVAQRAARLGMVAVPRACGIGAGAVERARQVEGEGYDAPNDDAQTDEQLARAGAAYALPWLCRPFGDFDQIPALPGVSDSQAEASGGLWPWDTDFWNPDSNRQRELEKAMALLAAEWDRIDRAAHRIAAGQAAELAGKRAQDADL